MVTAISALAYLALILLLVVGPPKSLRGSPGPALGLAGPLAGFLFLPNDGLPPFLDLAWSGPAFWLSLSLGPLGRMARGFRSRRSESFRRDLEMLLQLLALILAWLFLCFYALKRGLPGDLPGLSVFAATPLMAQAGPSAGLGLVCLLLALGPLAARREADSPALLMTRFSISAFLITVFFPFGLSGLVGARWFFGLDFFLFWGKVLLLNRVIAPRLAGACRLRAGRTAVGILAAAGPLLVMAEIF